MAARTDDAIEVRRHGVVGPPLVVLHGGPGAPGSAVGLARALARDFQVLEPLVLSRFVPQLEYVELDRCGHEPWRERHARDRFLELVRSWLAA